MKVKLAEEPNISKHIDSIVNGSPNGLEDTVILKSPIKKKTHKKTRNIDKTLMFNSSSLRSNDLESMSNALRGQR